MGNFDGEALLEAVSSEIDGTIVRLHERAEVLGVDPHMRTPLVAIALFEKAISLLHAAHVADERAPASLDHVLQQVRSLWTELDNGWKRSGRLWKKERMQ